MVTVSPPDGSASADVSTKIVVGFSERIDRASVTNTSVRVEGVTGTLHVDGSVVTLDPDSLQLETPYTVVLTTDIRDLVGNRMASPKAWSFRTRARVMANAGPDQDVAFRQVVTLDATASQADSLIYSWTQTWGPPVGILSGPTPTFTAPPVVSTLQFQLTVSDGKGSATDSIDVFVMEDPQNAYFVHPAGNDASPGTRVAPFASIQAAIDAANAAGKSGDVYVAGGDYPGDVLLRSGVSIYGGFDPVTWLRDPATVLTRILGGPTAVSGTGANGLTLEGLTVISSDADTTGGSSIAMLFNTCTNVVVRQNKVQAGAGAAGAPGAIGARGADGSVGASGTGSGPCTPPRSGGAGGVGVGFPGGGGGSGGPTNGAVGLGGQGPNPGAGGGGGAPAVAGMTGANGSTGWAGASGAGGGRFGSATLTGYICAGGAAGSVGAGGSGGGGGGGGGGNASLCGGGGGGGGSGGGGGGGGGSGEGGGASIGILLVGTSSLEIRNNTITTGAGGVGGPGGDAGPGGFGGAGGVGGPGGVAGPGAGGVGGVGGVGGRGGYGGGGGGGPSVCIVESKASGSIRVGNTFALGTPGAGGTSLGNAGLPGESAPYKKLAQ